MPISAIVAMTSSGIVRGATRLLLNCCHGEGPMSLGVADWEVALVLVELALFIIETFDDSARNGSKQL